MVGHSRLTYHVKSNSTIGLVLPSYKKECNVCKEVYACVKRIKSIRINTHKKEEVWTLVDKIQIDAQVDCKICLISAGLHELQ